MNLSPKMIPGLIVLLAGAILTFAARRITGREDHVPAVKLAGILLCAVGAALTICL
ncbi:MAG: hypothetical protein IJ088_12460 [Clostridia bacterium]|nr:hypothetical protein [Clostridia bacterium]